jgi:hypothetical protein
MKRRWSLVVGLILVIAACSEEEKPTRKLGEFLKFTGEAHGMDSGLTIDCLCDLNAELPEFAPATEGAQVYSGVLGGEITRAVTDGSGAGIALQPFLFGEIEVELKANDSVFVHWPGNVGTGIDFYDEITLFKGIRNADGTLSGKWWCAPFELDEGGYVDLVGRIEGTWQLIEME